MVFWCVVILALLNVVTLTLLWKGRPPLGRMQGPEGNPNGQKLMEERLQLSEDQARQFEQIRREHFARSRPLQDDMHILRMDILNEIFNAEPDQAKIQNLLSELSDKQSQFEKNLFTHFQELKSACQNEQQVKELKMMLRDLIERTRPRGPERQPMGPPGGMGPGHGSPPPLQ